MAEVNANSLPAKTDLGSNDSAIVVDQTTNAGALVDLDVLADKVLDRITSKTFANQVGGSSAATLLAQLSTLNSNFKAIPYIDLNSYSTVQDALDNELKANVSAAFVYANNATMAASSGPNTYAYGFAVRDSANFILALFFDNAGTGISTLAKTSGTWLAWHRTIFGAWNG